MNSAEHYKDKLMQDLNQVIKDAEELLSNSEQQAGEGYKNARVKFESSLKNAKHEVARIEDLLLTKSKDAARATDQYVKDNPWQSAGLAAGIGLLIGLLIARK